MLDEGVQVEVSKDVESNNERMNLIENKQQVHLQRWSLYCSRRGRQSTNSDYSKNITLIATISTLQQFFSYHLSLKHPSECLIDSKLIFFLQNHRPMWQEWLESGCLLLNFKTKDQEEMSAMDSMWQYLLFSMIGNSLDHQVIGICLCKRQKIALIQVWLRTGERASQIGQKMELSIKKDLPGIEKKLKSYLKIKYKKHRDSISSQSTIKGAHNLSLVHPRHLLNNTF